MAQDSAGQERRERAAPAEAEQVDAPSTSDVHDRVDKLTDDVDALLDEIDDVLEENAEEFVRGYVQKGGQ